MDVPRKLGLAGVGVVDEVMEWWDEKAGRTEPFRNAKDITRLALVGVGTGIEIFWPKFSRWGSIMSDGAIPLLVKSIAKPVRSAITSASAGKTYVPRKRAPAPPALPAGVEVPVVSEEPVITSVT